MEQLVQGIPMVAVYLDDILVSGRTLEEARANLLTVLSRLQTAGLRLRIEKCSFMQESCVYLGHRLDAEGIHPTNEKLLALQNAPEPKSVSELRSYLGMVNYYHKFLKNLNCSSSTTARAVAKIHSMALGVGTVASVRRVESVIAINTSAGSL